MTSGVSGAWAHARLHEIESTHEKVPQLTTKKHIFGVSRSRTALLDIFYTSKNKAANGPAIPGLKQHISPEVSRKWIRLYLELGPCIFEINYRTRENSSSEEVSFCTFADLA